jgi:hypothetical protein
MVERRWEDVAGLSAMEGWRLPVLVYRGASGRPGPISRRLSMPTSSRAWR